MTPSVDPRVDAYIDALPEWQQAICREVRELVHAADPDVIETIKLTNRPYFVLQGNICALLAAKDHVNVFLYDGGHRPRSRADHHRRPRQHDRPHGGHPSGRNDQRVRADRDVQADHRQQPGWRLAKAQARDMIHNPRGGVTRARHAVPYVVLDEGTVAILRVI